MAGLLVNSSDNSFACHEADRQVVATGVFSSKPHVTNILGLIMCLNLQPVDIFQ